MLSVITSYSIHYTKLYDSPDIAICDDCIKDIKDVNNFRFEYPFTNCTNCGPRYSIIETVPYDRVNTSMEKFSLCKDCKKEYEDPSNRRYHAQPLCCSKCVITSYSIHYTKLYD